ncbi:hypothetical protein [Ectopseudomonas toyotomiensis]|uniref:hypothetical protein n=1 Tax=Ectopseudomonas toyotomiensis TaxID=554344 RepID=UPI0018C40091|nr:hypothetical protein [Pseudomonas toyotomiensis]MBG0843204.1 hypothetical protein [Pseudomonas toyotomiensis]
MLVDKFTEWLQKTGFPLEMEAADAFRQAGFDVRQSATYMDPQSEKGREIDVLAMDPDLIGVIDISFVIECKSSEKPWVVFTSDDALSHYNRLSAFGITSEAARRALSQGLHRGLPTLGPYLSRPTRGGFGFRQAMSGNSDPAYDASIGALKACLGLALDRDGDMSRLAFAFPVIVVDTPLFECTRKLDGELELTPVERSEFLFSTHIPSHVGCCIRVVTTAYLQRFAREAKALANAIREDLQAEERNILRGVI